MTMSELTTNVQMPTQDFLALGLRDFAYIKPLAVGDGESVRIIFEIHTADGTPVGAVETRELAFAAVRQNGLEPVSAH
jgi:hypothetical protein